MKVLIVVAGLLFVAWQIDGRAIKSSKYELDENDEACIKELHLNRAKIAALDLSQRFPETTDVIKWVGCTARKEGIITSTNEIDYEKFKEELLEPAQEDLDFSPTTVKQYELLMTGLIDECRQSIDEDNVGHTLVKTMNCVLHKMKDLMGIDD